jgi:hypothetical protein
MMGFKGCTDRKPCGFSVVESRVTAGGLDVGGYGVDQVIDLHLCIAFCFQFGLEFFRAAAVEETNGASSESLSHPEDGPWGFS